jgi:hypothetical protein
VGAANGWLGEAESKRLVAEAGIAVPPGVQATDLAGCMSIAGEVGWPVALKLSGRGLRHKARVGALALDLGGEGELADAFARLGGLPEAAGAGYLVERMERPGVEAIVAARTDAVVPALVVGLGGASAEALDDVAIVPLPADPDRVVAALGTLRGAGAVAAAAPAIADVACRVGDLVLAGDLSLVELNPVSVANGRAVALDAVARVG